MCKLPIMKKKYLLLAILCLFLLSLNSCYFSSALRSGRTLSKGETEFGGTAAVFRALDTSANEDPLFYPEIFIATGLGEKADLQFKLGIFNLYAEGRYQLIGDRTSPFAGSVGLGVFGGGLALGSEALFFTAGARVPAYLSYHPAEGFAIYASPAISFNVAGLSGEAGGGSVQSSILAGLEFGRRFKLRMEGGIQTINPFVLDQALEDTRLPLGQFSFGLSYRFGDPRL